MTPMKTLHRSAFALVAAGLALAALPAAAQDKPAAKKLYCWDENGQRKCADSLPPEAMAATRCSTSIGMFAAFAFATKVSAMAASAMLMPPEAEPVMPASAVTVHG